MSQGEKAQWYLIQSKVRHELRSLDNLQRQGYHCFLPMYSAKKIRNGKCAEVIEPLFPGYLFIALNCINDNWAPIRSTRGVLRIVAFAGVPVAVPSPVVAQLVEIEQRDGFVSAVLKPGDAVRTTAGTFKELEAIFHSFNGEERMFVLLDFMQKQHKLSMPVKDVRTC